MKNMSVILLQVKMAKSTSLNIDKQCRTIEGVSRAPLFRLSHGNTNHVMVFGSSLLTQSMEGDEDTGYTGLDKQKF